MLVVASLERAAAGAPDNRGNSDAGGGRQMDSLLATSAILPGLIDKSLHNYNFFASSNIYFEHCRLFGFTDG